MAGGRDHVRDAGPMDAIAGVPARYVAEPASTQEAAAVLRAAAAQDLAVVVRGAGTRQDWAVPPRRLDLILETRRLTGVVKNAAGYDLGKLVTGSYGTLGLIAGCAFRLHPLPAATAVVTRQVDTPDEAGQVVAAVRAGQVVPSALEVNAPPDGPIEVAVLLEGVPAGVAGRVEVTRALLGGAETALPDWWSRYPWGSGDVGVKLTAALSGVPALLAAGRRVGAAVRGSAGTGVLYARAAPEAVGELRAAAHAAGGHAVVLTAPDGLELDRWGPVDGLALMRRVKAQFDPDGRLAPGRFVGGI